MDVCLVFPATRRHTPGVSERNRAEGAESQTVTERPAVT